LNGYDDEEETIAPISVIVDCVSKDTAEGYIHLNALYEIENTFGIDESELDDELRSELNRLRDSLEDETEQEDTDDDALQGEDKTEAPDSEATREAEETIDYTRKFVFRANSKNELLRNLMSQGIMGHNYLVLPTKNRPTFSIYYKGKRRLGIFKVREVSTRLAAKVAIDKLIKYLHKVNKYSEGMHVIEHILLRPQAQDQHGFILSDDQDNPILQSYQFGEIDQQRIYSDELVLVGIHQSNYSIRQDEEGGYIVVLSNNYDVAIGRYPEALQTEDEAENKLLDILDYIKSFKRSEMPIFDRLKFTTKHRNDSQEHTTEDFYSLTLSIIMPTWPSRFQNSDFKELIKNIIILNAPVYVHIDLQWLNSEEMIKFEEVYYDWLQERITLEPRQPELDDKAQRVMDMLVHNHNR
ncbi:MAG: hypothetical protein AB8E82_13005, partial [Aureispira sp.]